MKRSRRTFMQRSLGCAGYLASGLAMAPTQVRRAFAARPQRPVVAEREFARLEQLGAGVWGVVSTPLKKGGRHFETTSNGGIIQGSEGVLAIEGYYSDEGAGWVAGLARELTGRVPTHVVVTHFHADHCHGLPGLQAADADADAEMITLATPTTQALMRDNEEPLIPEHALSEETETTIDLGDRSVRIVARKGHTSSDITIEMEDPAVIWCGDLVWNGMFPNYVNAIPSHLTPHCEAILGRAGVTYVPGHGNIADAAGLASYLDLLRELEHVARRALEAGVGAADAAADYSLPESLGEWVMFSPDYIERALQAWHRELRAGV